MKRYLILITTAVLIYACETATDKKLKKESNVYPKKESPMARFIPFVGKFQTSHILYSQEGKEVDVFEGTAEIYFVGDGNVLVVDELTDDNRYRFVGYHSYNEKTDKYVNWTASSSQALAWSSAEWVGSNEVFSTKRIDPRTGEIDSLAAKGVWTLIDDDNNVFKAIRFLPDGTEIPFKEEKYKRINN
jgi:hypothetical protein